MRSFGDISKVKASTSVEDLSGKSYLVEALDVRERFNSISSLIITNYIQCSTIRGTIRYKEAQIWTLTVLRMTGSGLTAQTSHPHPRKSNCRSFCF